MTQDRSDKFREWLKDLTPEKVDKLVRMEKSVRLFIHVWNLVHEFDPKVFHALARSHHEIKSEYEGK